MTLDFTKPVQTRDGRPVRILCTDRKGEYSIIGLLGEDETCYVWKANGRANNSYPCEEDLVQGPVVTHKWMYMYGDQGGALFNNPLPYPPAGPQSAVLKLTYTDGKLNGVELVAAT